MSTDIEALRARLEAAKAARGELKEQTAPLDEAELLQLAVEAEERKLADETAIAALKVKHGSTKLAIVETDMGAIVLHRAKNGAFKQFQELEKAVKMDDIEALVRPCVLHPSHKEFDTIIYELPAVLTACGQAISYLAGVRKETVSGK